MKSALGVDQSSEGFPQQLTPSGLKGDSLPIPAVGFHEAAPSLKKIFNNQRTGPVQRDISKKQTHPPFRERVPHMASRPKY